MQRNNFNACQVKGRACQTCCSAVSLPLRDCDDEQRPIVATSECFWIAINDLLWIWPDVPRRTAAARSPAQSSQRSKGVPYARLQTERKRGNQECATAPL